MNPRIKFQLIWREPSTGSMTMSILGGLVNAHQMRSLGGALILTSTSPERLLIITAKTALKPSLVASMVMRMPLPSNPAGCR